MSHTRGSEKRKTDGMVRVSARTHARLRAEMLKRSLASLGATVDALLPGSRVPVGECRYCAKMTQAPTRRHNGHEAHCHLWTDKDYDEM